MNLKFKLSFIDVQEMNELGGRGESCQSVHKLKSWLLNRLLFHLVLMLYTKSHWVSYISIFTTGQIQLHFIQSTNSTLLTFEKMARFKIYNFLFEILIWWTINKTQAEILSGCMCCDSKHEYMNFSLIQSFGITTWQRYGHVTENL
jgi:hypothetical protein